MKMDNDTFRELIQLLTPHDIEGLSKKRFGVKSDGGYIVPIELIRHCTDLITYGVGDDTTFEMELCSQNRDINCYLFDHTIETTPLQPKWIFQKTGLGTVPGQDLDTFQNHIFQYGLEKANLLLKIDIEGSEWATIPTLDLHNVMILIIEVHFLCIKEQWPRYVECLKHIARTMILFHSHGNNYGHFFSHESFSVPNSIELTYVQKKHAKSFSKPKEPFPIKNLDFPNNPAKPDVNQNYWQDCEEIEKTKKT